MITQLQPDTCEQLQQCRVLIADDHNIFAETLSQYLRQFGCEVLATVSNGLQLLERARALRPTVILADISMPQSDGLDALRRLKAERIDVPVIILTMHADVELACEAIRAGASGYVLKSASGEDLLDAIKEVRRGSVYISPSISDGMFKAFASPAAERTRHKVSPRQRQVLQLLTQGMTMKEVAAVLDLSRRTVESHKYQMMMSLGVRSTAELVKYAMNHGMITD